MTIRLPGSAQTFHNPEKRSLTIIIKRSFNFSPLFQTELSSKGEIGVADARTLHVSLYGCLGYNCGLVWQVVLLHTSARRSMSVVQIFIIVITFLIAIVIIKCAFNFYKLCVSRSDQRNNKQQSSSRQFQQLCSHSTPALTPAAASMACTLGTVLDRQLLEPSDHQDHLVRLHSVQTDLALNLPPSIALPDGEEGAKCDIKMLKLRDPEQQAEITCSFIRPPPNRTISNSEHLQPLLSNSVPSLPPLPHVNATILVPRSHSVSHVNNTKADFVRRQRNMSKSGSSHILLPSSAAENSDNVRYSETSKRNSMHICTQAVTDNKSDNTLQPPSYYDIVKSKTRINPFMRHQKTGSTTNSRICSNSKTSNTTINCVQTLTDRDCENFDPPPAYSDVVSKTDMNSVNKHKK